MNNEKEKMSQSQTIDINEMLSDVRCLITERKIDKSNANLSRINTNPSFKNLKGGHQMSASLFNIPP